MLQNLAFDSRGCYIMTSESTVYDFATWTLFEGVLSSITSEVPIQCCWRSLGIWHGVACCF